MNIREVESKFEEWVRGRGLTTVRLKRKISHHFQWNPDGTTERKGYFWYYHAIVEERLTPKRVSGHVVDSIDQRDAFTEYLSAPVDNLIGLSVSDRRDRVGLQFIAETIDEKSRLHILQDRKTEYLYHVRPGHSRSISPHEPYEELLYEPSEPTTIRKIEKQFEKWMEYKSYGVSESKREVCYFPDHGEIAWKYKIQKMTIYEDDPVEAHERKDDFLEFIGHEVLELVALSDIKERCVLNFHTKCDIDPRDKALTLDSIETELRYYSHDGDGSFLPINADAQFWEVVREDQERHAAINQRIDAHRTQGSEDGELDIDVDSITEGEWDTRIGGKRTEFERLSEDQWDVRIGETLKQRRPDISVADHLKRTYFGEYPSAFQTRDMLMISERPNPPDPPDYSFMLTLEACINDEERFWFSMCYVRSFNFYSARNWDKYVDHISENADRFDEKAEVARLLMEKYNQKHGITE